MEIVWRFWADWQITALTLFVQIRPTDGISFMGKDWDKALPDRKVWKECLRVLKPGAFAFVMASPRQDVLCNMINSLGKAGFNTNFTSLYWTYAEGYFQAHNTGKVIDKRAGAERKVVGKSKHNKSTDRFYGKADSFVVGGGEENFWDITEPATDDAKRFDGAYASFRPKPAVEVIIVAMKPKTQKTYVDQALNNGKGITWLDDCQIPGKDKDRCAANFLVSDDVLDDYSRFFSLDAWAEKKLPFLVVPKASKQEKNSSVKNHHPTVKPITLMSYLITMGSREGDLVLDPFLGSGSTCVAAKMLGRSAIGIEIDKEYCEIARERIMAVSFPESKKKERSTGRNERIQTDEHRRNQYNGKVQERSRQCRRIGREHR
jgi:site-specific DNA-methyltransferase (adenine-specific)